MLERIANYLESLKEQNNVRTLNTIKNEGKYINFNGNKLLNFSSNDYLSLGQDLSLVQEFLQTHLEPLSSSSSRLLTGSTVSHDNFEQTLEYYYHKSALSFNSGYHMNTGIIPALTTSNSLILADKLVHASIIDGILLSKAKFLRYKHNSIDHLTYLLEKYHNQYDDIFIVTESVFSMDGDFAPLLELSELKYYYPNVYLYVDEAHAVGVFGPNGLGLCYELHVEDKIDILCATLGKALASMGAYCIVDKLIKDYLINTMRPLIFSTALPPMNLAFSDFMFKKMTTMDLQRAKLLDKAKYLRDAIIVKYGSNPSQSQIVPLIVGSNDKAVALGQKLQDHKILALPIREPTVPRGSARIRFSLQNNLNYDDLNRVIECI